MAKSTKDPKLIAPSSIAVRYQVAELLNGSHVIAYGAALGVCWRGAGAPRAKWRVGGAAVYGEQVIEYLVGKRGMTFEKFCELGAAAVAVIGESLPTDAEDEAALGNSEGQEGNASTS